MLEGLDLIAELVKRAAGRIIVMPGGGITARTTSRGSRRPAARAELHFASLEPREGRMAHRNPRVFMGGTLRPPEYSQDVTRPESVAAVIAAARPPGSRPSAPGFGVAPLHLHSAFCSLICSVPNPARSIRSSASGSVSRWAREVDALEPLEFRPEPRAAVEVDPGLSQEELVERLLRQTQRAAIEQREVRALRPHETDARNSLGQEPLHEVHVPLEVRQQFVQPGRASR